jgi:hypothetical protein
MTIKRYWNCCLRWCVFIQTMWGLDVIRLRAMG